MKRKKYSIFTILWIVFWAVLPTVLSLFAVFNLRIGRVQDDISSTIPSGKFYYSVRMDANEQLEAGDMVVVYIEHTKYVVPVVYTAGMDVSTGGYRGDWGSNIVQNGYFCSVEGDNELTYYPIEWIWGEANILGG